MAATDSKQTYEREMAIDIAETIKLGTLDKHLAKIEIAIKSRKTAMSAPTKKDPGGTTKMLAGDYKAGDRVRFSSKIRPVYLQNTHARILPAYEWPKKPKLKPNHLWVMTDGPRPGLKKMRMHDCTVMVNAEHVTLS